MKGTEVKIKALPIVLLLIFSLLLSACGGSPDGPRTVGEVLALKGLENNQEYQLLSLEKMERTQGSFRGSGGFFFISGSIRTKGEIYQETRIKFAFESSTGIVSVVEFPVSSIEFIFKEERNNPSTSFSFKDSDTFYPWHYNANSYIDASLARILQESTGLVTIKLTRETFSQEIAPFIK